jgi:hypothetical protein
MTQREIKKAIKEINSEIEDINLSLELAKVKKKAIQKKCKHPKMYTYYAMGEPGCCCPDCEYQD